MRWTSISSCSSRYTTPPVTWNSVIISSAGSTTSVWTSPKATWSARKRSTYGARWALRLLGLLILLLGVRAEPSRRRSTLCWVGGAVTCLGTASLGHAASGSFSPTRLVADAAHLGATLSWGGAVIVLAITPLRQLTGQPVLIRFRRMLGLYAFFYACLHFAAYLGLDLRGYWTQIFAEIVKRPYITVGFSAWLLLVPLAITSTQGWIRRLGRNWGHLHKLVYAVGVLAVLHFWWLVKSDIREPLLYASILAALLGWRLWKRFSRRRTAAAR